MVLQCLSFWQACGIDARSIMLEGSKDSMMRRVVAQLTENANHMDNEWVEKNYQVALAQLEPHVQILDKMAGAITNGTLDGDPTYSDVKLWIARESEDVAKILVVDPITSADNEGKPWEADKALVGYCQASARKYGNSIVLVTHPAKQGIKIPPSLDGLAGGTAFSRHVDSVLWLEKIDSQPFDIASPMGGTYSAEIDRRLHLLKVRDGRGQGMVLGMNFSGGSLSLVESGVIVKSEPTAAI